MKLYLMRHADAEDVSEEGADFDRTLTAKGRSRARTVAKALRRHANKIELVVASPVIRAIQTAEIVASVLKPDKPVSVNRAAAPGGKLVDLGQRLSDGGFKSVLIVGHEPGMSEAIRQFSNNQVAVEDFAKAMVAAFRKTRGGVWEIRWIIDPKTGEKVDLPQDN